MTRFVTDHPHLSAEALLDSPAVRWSLERGGRIVEISPNVTHYLGWTPQEMYGRFLASFLAYRDQDPVRDLLVGSAASGGDWSGQACTFIGKGGIQHRLLCSGSPRRDRRGSLVGFDGALRPVLDAPCAYCPS